jgi:hypothetical protein
VTPEAAVLDPKVLSAFLRNAFQVPLEKISLCIANSSDAAAGAPSQGGACEDGS